MILRKLLAFAWQEWAQAKSYKVSFLMQNIGMLMPMVMLFFLSRVFHGVEVQTIARYGGDYVLFSFVGLVVATYSFTSLQAFSGGLRGAQTRGTLEVLLLTRASLPTIVIGWSLYPFLRSTVQLLVYLATGFFILGLSLEGVNLAGALVTLALTIVVMGGLGVLAASFTLVFKRGDPFTGIIVAASGILSGAVYPVSVLPGWLQVAAGFLPQTHAIEAMRMAVLQGYSVGELLPHLAPLALFALTLPAAMLAFNVAMHIAKAEGSLAHY